MSASPASSGGWIPLMDYAMKKGVSLSTLRRYIKANKIRFKSEQGRYLIWDEDGAPEAVSTTGAGAVAAGPTRWNGHSSGKNASQDAAAIAVNARKIEELESQLLRAQEEIAELKMLVALYEEQLFQKKPSFSL